MSISARTNVPETLFVDAGGRILAAGPAADAGTSPSAGVGRRDAPATIDELFPKLQAAQWRAITGCLSAGPAALRETNLQTEARGQSICFLRIRRFVGDGGEVFLVEVMPASAALDEAQRRDPVTGLADRTAAADQFNAWRRDDPAGLRAAILFVDLDGFKQVNDNYGHAAGDRALRRIAGLLQACVRESDVVCRYGGDEFLVLLKGVDSVDAAAPVVDRLRAATATTIDVDQRAVRLTASIGVAIFSGGETSFDAVVAEADQLMYAAKRGKRS